MTPSRGRPTLQEIRKVARETCTGLAKHGLDSCLFGSAACAMYGMSRTPNDVDVIVLNLWDSWDVEDVKKLLKEGNDNFFLVSSTNPRNTYKVLWYTLPSQGSQSSRSCKVDILVPGLVDIPEIPVSRTLETNIPGVHVPPYLVLLFLKLRGWHDHRHHFRSDMIAKQHVDVRDINELLRMLDNDDRLDKEKWMPNGFVKKARKRVREYVDAFPQSADSWRSIGFQVSD